MDRLELLVIDKELILAEEVMSPTSGAIYHGYTDTSNVRTGWGQQVWPDGGRYEGEWQSNRAHGKGKFWHSDGDIYEGDWKDDKANGYGLYKHADGA